MGFHSDISPGNKAAAGVFPMAACNLMASYRVTFVCLGNICRSPMAAAVLRQQLEQVGLAATVTVDSAGTGDWHVGGPADERAQAALERRGYESAHTARQFDPAWFGESDLVVALDRSNLRDLRRLARNDASGAAIRLLMEFDPVAGVSDVPDPYHGDDADFDAVLEQIETACGGLVHFIEAALLRRSSR